MHPTRTLLLLCVDGELEVTVRLLVGKWAEKGMLCPSESYPECPAGALAWHHSGQHTAEEGR